MAKTNEQAEVKQAKTPVFTYRKVVANYSRAIRFRSRACPKC